MKNISLFIAIAFLFCLCGCSGYREINHGYLVTAVGIGAENDRVSLVVEVISSSDIADKTAERRVLTSNGDSVDDAFKNLKSNLIKPLYFEQLGTVVIENSLTKDVLSFLKKTTNNYGVYIVKCDDVNAVFNFNSANGVLGYDIIGLIKNHEKEGKKANTQFYQIRTSDKPLPTINIVDDRLVIKD